MWIGPYEVTSKISAVVYHLNLPPKVAIHDVFHAYLLKPHHRPVSSHLDPIILADINTAEYEVEALLQHHFWKYDHTMKTKYLVKWKGYPLHEAA